MPKSQREAESVQLERVPRSPGKMPAVFIVTAMLNFLAGAGLGAWMAAAPATWAQYGLIHRELNPFGWLTLLIYGMTFAVLALLAGLQLPWSWLAGLQWVSAEGGVVAIVTGDSVHSTGWLQLGAWLQAAAPVLFLVNILSAVVVSRRRILAAVSGRKPETGGELRIPAALRAQFQQFFGRPTYAKPTDIVGQRGTELALVAFVGAVVWIACAQSTAPAATSAVWPSVALEAVYYGWIAGTVIAVALHLYPRYAGRTVIRSWEAQVAQVLWALGVAGLYLSAAVPVAHGLAIRLIGASLAWISGLLLLHWRGSFRGLPTAIQSAWLYAWGYAFALGVGLLLGWRAMALVSLHVLFLGWITTLVYGVGYTLFPLLLKRQPASWRGATLQVTAGVAGALLMVLGFYGLDHAWHLPSGGMLAVGGSLATLSYIAFTAQWLLGKSVTPDTEAAGET